MTDIKEAQGLEVVGFVVLGGLFHGGSGPELGDIDIEPDMGALERIQYELVDSSDDVIVSLCSLPKAQAVIDKLRAANGDLQLHFDTLKADYEALKSATVVMPEDKAIEQVMADVCEENKEFEIGIPYYALCVHEFKEVLARLNRSKT